MKQLALMVLIVVMVCTDAAQTRAQIGPPTQWPSVYDRLEATVYPVLSVRVVTSIETTRAANRAAVDGCQAPTPDPLITPLIWRPNVYYIIDYWDTVTAWNTGNYIWSWNGVWKWHNPGCN